ncbi:hypothetical protein EAE96_001893 [Botrytis aclada]|nr:hypothetical protein EAE96_001893 [Botrytis aclada]
MLYRSLLGPSPHCREQPQYQNKDLKQKFKAQDLQSLNEYFVRYMYNYVYGFKEHQVPIETAGDIPNSWESQTADSGDFDNRDIKGNFSQIEVKEILDHESEETESMSSDDIKNKNIFDDESEETESISSDDIKNKNIFDDESEETESMSSNDIQDKDIFDDESEETESMFADDINRLDLKQAPFEWKSTDSMLERIPTEVRQMIFAFCGRNTFCSADQGPSLLKALRGQCRAYSHALDIFERLNSYELGVELRNHTSRIRHTVHDMTRLMTVNKASHTISSTSSLDDSNLAKFDLKLTLHSENLKFFGSFGASTPRTVLYDLVRQLHIANHIRDVQFYQETSLPKDRSSLIIFCQNDRGDWTFLKDFLTLIPCRIVTRVIVQLPNPEKHCVNLASRYDNYYRDNYYESYRARQDAFALAVIESINQKVGVEGVVLGRSKDNLSGFCVWEAPEGRYMDWHHDVIEPWALWGGFDWIP